MVLSPEALIRARHGVWMDRLEIIQGRIAAGEENPGAVPIKDELPVVVARIQEIEYLAAEMGIDLSKHPSTKIAL